MKPASRQSASVSRSVLLPIHLPAAATSPAIQVSKEALLTRRRGSGQDSAARPLVCYSFGCRLTLDDLRAKPASEVARPLRFLRFIEVRSLLTVWLSTLE